MASTVKVEGLAELLRTLQSLPAAIAAKSGGPVRSALFRAAKVIRDAARANAPIRTGALRKAIFIYRDRNPAAEGHTEQYKIGVRKVRLNRKERKQLRELLDKMKDQGINARVVSVEGDPYYWRFVEFGTARTKANPFMRNALDQNHGQALDEFVNSFRKGIANAVKRARQS